MALHKNWSGSVRFKPAKVVYPTSEKEICNLIREAAANKGSVRVVGAGHSFTPLVETQGMLMNLDQMQGLDDFDEQGLTASIKAGTRLYNLGDLLHVKGLAMENLGDINQQSLAGAVGTGTHGTGIRFGNIPSQALELRMVKADGTIVTCSEEENADLFRAAKVSLGSLGVMSSIMLRVKKPYKLEYRSSKARFEDTLPRLEEYKTKNRNFEFYWFPYSETVQLKESNETELPVKDPGFGGWFNDLFMENGVFWVLSKQSRYLPFLAPTVSRISAWGVSASKKVNWSHKVYATPRLVRFNEMEYNLPAEAMVPALRAVKKEIEKERFRVHFPLECRWSKGDEAWLSPAHGRDSAYIAVHMYKGMPHEAYFKAMERIFLDHGGRPHWGKMHFLSAKELSGLYPKWNDFLAMREQMDPGGMFLNTHLRKLFGL